MADLSRWWWLGVLLVLGIVLYALSPILSPFLIAATLAYMGDPLADWLESKKVNRTVAVVIVFLLFTLLGFLFVLMMLPMLKQQVELVASKTPVALELIKTDVIPWINEKVGTEAGSFDVSSIEQKITEQISSNTSIIASVFKSITSSGLALFAWLGNLVLIPVVTFYLLRDWDGLVDKVYALFPRKTAPVVKLLASECDDVLSAFMRGQLMVMFALGCIYAVGLWIVGLDLALLVGMIAGIASIVPYLGFIIGIIFAVVAALIQFGDPSVLLWIGLVFAIGQMLEGMVLTPLLVGDKIGLHPVAVIFAILAGGQLFGFVGVLIALPVAAVAMVMLRHAHDKYVNSMLYGNEAESEVKVTVAVSTEELSDQETLDNGKTSEANIGRSDDASELAESTLEETKPKL